MGTNESLAVRRAAAGDAEEMFRLSVEAIRASAAGYYTVPQLEAWAGRRTVETHRQMIEETFALVAVTDEGIVGFATIALEPAGSLVAGEVDQLFVSPRHGGRGVARQLLSALEDPARQKGLHELVTHASWRAAGTFASAGYREVRSESVSIDGQTLTRALMRKTL